MLGEKKGSRLKRVRARRIIACLFRWNFEGSRNLIRAHTAEFREGNDPRSREIEGRPIQKKRKKKERYRDIRTWAHLLRTGRTRQTTFLERKFIENYFTVQLLAICSLSSENFLRDRDTSTLWNLFLCARYISLHIFQHLKLYYYFLYVCNIRRR